ncbi:MAG: 50S ribosomal protein L10 [Candidatus Thermoplasmatota archaeon]|nr:50S ribosomal protein L10 [Candidatus Thermoplasmatota archaeon]
MAHVAQWKYREVEELSSLLKQYPVIGIVEIGSIPAPQMQSMRQNLRGNMIIRSSKNTLILRAIDAAEKDVKGLNGLKEIIDGQSALIATEINPFKLQAKMNETKTKAPAKGGELADEDIKVKAGDTPFKPGPIVGDLQKAGIPAAIQGGKVVIKKDKTIVKKGDVIPRDVAQMLTRLEIYPLDIGISLQGVFEDGFIFKPDVLDIDLDAYRTQFIHAAGNAFSLAIETAWISKDTIIPLIAKAHCEARSLAIEQGILTKDTASYVLAKAHRSMVAIASKIKKEGLDDELKEMT